MATTNLFQVVLLAKSKDSAPEYYTQHNEIVSDRNHRDAVWDDFDAAARARNRATLQIGDNRRVVVREI